MISDGRYRFTLQFPMDTKEQRTAGYLLNQLGRRKSSVVVRALNEYANRHPEVWKEGAVSNATPATVRPAVRTESKQTTPIPRQVRTEPVIEPAAPPARKPDGPSPGAVWTEPVAGYSQPQREEAPTSEPGPNTQNAEFQQAVLAMVADLESFL